MNKAFERCFVVSIVYTLRSVPYRTGTGHYQYHPQRLRHTIYDDNGICFYLWFISQQPDRSRRNTMCARHHSSAYPHRICFCITTVDILCSVPQPCTEYLHRYSGTAGSLHTIIMGTMHGLSDNDSV